MTPQIKGLFESFQGKKNPSVCVCLWLCRVVVIMSCLPFTSEQPELHSDSKV